MGQRLRERPAPHLLPGRTAGPCTEPDPSHPAGVRRRWSTWPASLIR